MNKVADQTQRSGSPIRECMPDISISFEESQNLYKSLTSGNLENASRLWKKYGYIFLEPLKPRQNFELIRSITKIKDNNIAQLEAELRLLSRNKYNKILKEKEYEIEILRNTLVQKDTQNPEQNELFKASRSTFDSEIQGKNNEIKELMKEVENLQYKLNEIEEENNNLKGILQKTTDVIKSRSDGFNFQKIDIDQEVVYLKQICNEYSLKNQYLESELKIIKNKKGEIYDLRDHLLQLLTKAQLGEDEIAKINFNISEIIDCKINEQLEFIQSSIIDSFKMRNESYQNEKIIKDIECVKLNSEIKKLNKLLENEKIINQEIKRMPKEGYEANELRKIRNDTVERIETAYEEQTLELNECIKELSDRSFNQIKEINELKDQSNYKIKEVAGKLKREHEMKKEIAEHYSKEKLSHEKTKEQLKKLLDYNNEIIGKLNEESTNTSEKSKQIYELEVKLEKCVETIKNLELNDKMNSKQTKLSKKSNEIETNITANMPELHRDTENFYQQKESQTRVLQEKEEAIENLLKINQKLKNEIVNLDYKIQLKDNIIKRFKKNEGIEEMETEIFELKRENEEIKEKNKSDIELIEQLKSEILKLQNELSSLENNLKKLTEPSNSNSSEDKHLKDYMARFDDFEKRYSSLLNDYDYSQKECAKLSEEKAKFQLLNSQLMHEKELFCNQIKELEGKLNKPKAKSNKEKESQTEKCRDYEINDFIENIKEKFEKWTIDFDIKHQIIFSDIRDVDVFINILIEEYKKLKENEKISVTFQHINDERSQSVNILDAHENSSKPKNSPMSCITAFGNETFSSYTEQKHSKDFTALNQRFEEQKHIEKLYQNPVSNPNNIQLKVSSENNKQISINNQFKTTNSLSNIPLPNEESKDIYEHRNQIYQEISIEDAVKLLKSENSHLYEIIKILEEENGKLKNTIKIFREDCDEWKKSLTELYNNLKQNSQEKLGDITPKEAMKKIYDVLSSKEDIINTKSPKNWSQKEDVYMQTIESLTIEKRYLIKSVEDYEKELQNLRKQLDFYKIASNSQNGERRKKNSLNSKNHLSYSENLSSGPKSKEKLTIEELESQSKYTEELIKIYKQDKPNIQAKLLNHYKIPTNISRSSRQELFQALYEEQSLRQELESELSRKCDLIDELLIELENKRRFIQTREYEFQEILTLKDQEILKFHYKAQL